MILATASFVTAHVHPAAVWGIQSIATLIGGYWFLVWFTRPRS